MRYQDDMSEMFDSLTDLTEHQRTTIKHRYRFLLNEYRYRAMLYSVLFYVTRVTMTAGSLAVPALLSLQNAGDARIMYWFTWALSLAVTTANGITTLFKIDRRFFSLHSVMEHLRTDTWQYLELSGRYSGHYGHVMPTHRNQYIYYCSRIEKIRMKHIEEEYDRQAQIGDTPQQTQLTNANPQQPQIIVPSPAELASTINLKRRESIATVESNETVIELGTPEDKSTKQKSTKYKKETETASPEAVTMFQPDETS